MVFCAAASASHGVTRLTGPIEGQAGPRDLCFTFTKKAVSAM
jgi:hypothetical protein